MTGVKKLFHVLVIFGLLLALGSSQAALALPVSQEKGPQAVQMMWPIGPVIQNTNLKTAVTITQGVDGRFVIGTTGGDPNSANDNNKGLLYGYSINDAGTSFTSVRIIDGATVYDAQLSGFPTTGSTSNGSQISTVYNLGVSTIQQKLYFITNPDTGREDTTAIEYVVTNHDSVARTIGLRIMLDVMIGGNDGAPYFIQGAGQLTQEFEFTGANIPEYWIAYESPTFAADSLKGIGRLYGSGATRPDRVVIAHWGKDLCSGVVGITDTAWDYTPDPLFQATCDSAVALYYNPVSIPAGQSKTYRTYYGIAKSGGAAQLELTGLEATQVVQDLDNRVMLIGSKPTTVRAHVRSTMGTVADVTAELVGKRGGIALPGSPLKPSNLGGNLDVLEYPNRVSPVDSFNFDLPLTWLGGTIELEFRGVSHTFVCKESASLGNDCKASLTFTDASMAEVSLQGIPWTSGGPAHTPTWEDLIQTVYELETIYPIPRLKWSYAYTPSLFPHQPTSYEDFLALNRLLKMRRAMEGCYNTATTTCGRYYLGILVDPPLYGILGMADNIPADVASAYITGSYTPAHELGHAAGQYHTLCLGYEGGPDLTYPYPGGVISLATSGNDAYFGFNPGTRQVFQPQTGDLMSYCRPRWPSQWTYAHFHEEFLARFGPPTAPPQSAPASTALVVSGQVDPKAGSGVLAAVYALDVLSSLELPTPGSYTIQFQTASGAALASYSFEPGYNSEDAAESTGISTPPKGVFALLLLKPVETSFAKIVLLKGTTVLDTLNASAHAPTVTVTSPNGGENLNGATADITWTGNDLDGGVLLYTVQYSTNSGVSWQTLTVDKMGTSLTVDLDFLEGTATGLVRVLASDGFHSSQDMSNAVFSVRQHAPHAFIKSPADGSLFVSDQTILFNGSGYDLESGQIITPARLTWYSNLNGALGNGSALAVNASTLTPGTHTITLSADDGVLQSAASITIQVASVRPVLPKALVSSPGALLFKQLKGFPKTDWQSIAIRNNGDGVMNWTAQKDQPWILLTSLAGAAPADLLITVNPAGLVEGEHTGHVTITAAGAADSPQVIEVYLVVQPPYQNFLPIVSR